MSINEVISLLQGHCNGILTLNADFFNEVIDILEVYYKLEEDFTELVMKSPEICEYCKHNTECRGKECPKYINGQGCTDENGKYVDWKWSCEDFDYGDCPLLENTQCNGCIQNGNKGFEWRGNR